MLDHPLASLDDYVLFLSQAEIPVLRLTERELTQFAATRERVAVHDLTPAIFRDPLMTLKVLAFIQPIRGKVLQSEITTVGAALTMLGVEPFFRQFASQPTVEAVLLHHPDVILSVLRRVRRAQRAAHFAHRWATWRHDRNLEEVTIAALLHDMAEILLWTFAPALGRQVDRLRQRDPSMRSQDAQIEVFGITTPELQSALCAHWNLPGLLRQLMDDAHADHPRVRNVALAVSLARHTAEGWHDPAIPDDLKGIGELLGLSEDGLRTQFDLPPPEDTAVQPQ